MNHLSKIEISSDNLLFNIDQVKKFVAPEKPKIAAVVKANSYGHGVKEVVSVVEDYVDYFQVDDLLELKEIRQYTKKPVLVFGFVASDQLEDFVDLDGIMGVYDFEILKSLNQIASSRGKEVTVHLKIDSQLGRQGVLVEDAEDFLEKIKDLKNIKLEAVYSHFSNIEDVEHLGHAQKQFDGLMKVKEIAQQKGFSEISHHISATSGILTSAEKKWGGAIVRLGIGLYGMWPSEDLQKKYDKKIEFRPVMRWSTKIAQIKKLPANYPIGYGCTYITGEPMKIAVIPQGYSDGYGRHFSNNSEVLISGQRCPVLGRIAMNMFVVDVTKLDDSELKIEDEVVLLGSQQKQNTTEEETDTITAEELANRIDTINYEITTKVWPKLERVIV